MGLWIRWLYPLQRREKKKELSRVSLNCIWWWGSSSEALGSVGLVLWHTNHCRLFNAKSSLYISIKYIGFVNILTLLNKPALFFFFFFFFLHTVKLFQVALFNANHSVEHYSFVCTQLNDSKYCDVLLTIQLNISYLFVFS